MGGKNEQPGTTRDPEYLEFSSLMSRYRSAAYASVEQANITLEDALLREMGVDDRSGDIHAMRTYLTESRTNLDGFKVTIKKLQDSMKKNGYVDPAKEMKVDVGKTVARDLAKAELAHDGSLNQIASTMKSNGYNGVLTVFDGLATQLQRETLALGAKTDMLEKHAGDKQLIKVLEENLHGNIKVEFARLFNHWNTFNQMFLASSVISTELWYRYTKVNSLIG